MSFSARRWIPLLVIIATVLLTDQITKRLIVDNYQLYESRTVIPALSPFFQITYSRNNGAAFGLLPQAGDLFLIIAIVVSIGMIIFYPRIPDAAIVRRLAFGLVCGGAMGNALDRLEYGHVIDFIHYQIPGLISNVSNLADHAIVFGVLLLFVESWRDERHKQAEPSTPDSPASAPDTEGELAGENSREQQR